MHERWAAEELAGSQPRKDPVQPPSSPPPAYRDMHLRLRNLLYHSKSVAYNLTVFSVVSATIVFGGLLLLGTNLAKAAAAGDFDGFRVNPFVMSGLEWITFINIVFLAAMLGFLLVMAVRTLALVPGLYRDVRIRTLEELAEGSIGLVVADDGFWQKVPARLRRSWLGTMIARHSYNGIDDHMIYCACHWESLRWIAQARGEISRWRYNMGHQAYTHLKWFYNPKPWQILVGCILGLLLIIQVVFAAVFVFTIHGIMLITVYARSAALCEHFIGEKFPP